MNKIIQAIATVMMVLLLMILICIFLSYYKEYDTVDTVSFLSGDTNVSTPGIPNNNYILGNEEKYNYDNLIASIQKRSGEELISKNSGQDGEKEISASVEISGNIDSGEEIIKSGDGKTENDGEKVVSAGEQREPGNQLVIISDPETSNEEKQEVLTEIDEALKGLLEAVGKVEVVDETRLDATLNSEVEIP